MSAYNNYVSKTQAKRVDAEDTTIKQKTALITRQKELELKHLYVDSTYNCAQQLTFHITDKLDSLNNEFPWRLEEYKKLRDSIQHKASELFDIKSIEDMDKHSGIKELTQFGTIDWFTTRFLMVNGSFRQFSRRLYIIKMIRTLTQYLIIYFTANLSNNSKRTVVRTV